MLIVRHLEPSKLSTVLIGPLSHILLRNNGCVTQSSTIIILNSNILAIGKFLDMVKLGFLAQRPIFSENVAKFLTLSELNSKSEDVGKEEGEIIYSHTVWYVEDVSDLSGVLLDSCHSSLCFVRLES